MVSTEYEVLFPLLNDDELALAASVGTVETFREGDIVFEVGDHPLDFFVILNGEIQVFDTSSGEERHLKRSGRGGFTGEIGMLAGYPAFARCRAVTDCELIRLNAEQTRELLVQAADFAEKWIPALMARRQSMTAGSFEGYRVFGPAGHPPTLEVRSFLDRNGLPYRWLDCGDPESSHLLPEGEWKPEDFPLISWAKQVILRNPSIPALADHLGVRLVLPDMLFDVVIIGSGPSGLGAAVYAASEGLSTLVLDALGPGGQAGSSSRIENFAGFPAGVSGRELALRSYVQALKFGARFSSPVRVEAVGRNGDGELVLTTDAGQPVRTKTLVVATGVSYRKLAVPGLRERQGAGVYYAATGVEAVLCRQAPVHIIGAGNSAGQAAMFLCKFSPRVNLVVRGGDLGKSMSSYLADRVKAEERIQVRYQTELRGVGGEGRVSTVTLEDKAAQTTTEEPSCAVFIFIGASPYTEFLGDAVMKDDHGFLCTDPVRIPEIDTPEGRRKKLPLETTMAGVFAAGDCRADSTKRVAAAVGDGALAINSIHEILGTYA